MTRDLFHAVAVRYRNELAWLRFRIQAVLLARRDAAFAREHKAISR